MIRQSLSESLEEIGGPSVRDSVFYYLREKYHVDLNKVSSNPSTLTKALSDIFGVGAGLIEKRWRQSFLPHTI
jgi:hypothetical protein